MVTVSHSFHIVLTGLPLLRCLWETWELQQLVQAVNVIPSEHVALTQFGYLRHLRAINAARLISIVSHTSEVDISQWGAHNWASLRMRQEHCNYPDVQPTVTAWCTPATTDLSRLVVLSFTAACRG